jgi:hypothetical protein
MLLKIVNVFKKLLTGSLKICILLNDFFVSHLVEFHFATDNGRVIPKWKQNE